MAAVQTARKGKSKAAPAAPAEPAFPPIEHPRARALVADLLRLVNGERPPGGVLVAGERGIGKSGIARALAETMLFGDRPRPASAVHPDLVAVYPDPKLKTRTITMEQAVEATSRLRLTPAAGSRRVCLVDAADDLNRSSANALLKVIEEPPPGACFILVCHRPGALPATIRSRCALFRVPTPEAAEAEAALRAARPALAGADAAALLALAGGVPGVAATLADAGALAMAVALDRAVAPLGREGGRIDRRALSAFVDAHGAEASWESAAALVLRLVHRAACAAAGAPVPGGLAGEAARDAALGGRCGTARLAALWRALDRMRAEAGALHLDRRRMLRRLVLGVEHAASRG